MTTETSPHPAPRTLSPGTRVPPQAAAPRSAPPASFTRPRAPQTRHPDLAIWPRSAQFTADGADMRVGGVRLTGVAVRHGTPAYVIDETEARQRCRAHLDAFPDGVLVSAAPALLRPGPLAWIEEEKLGLALVSAAELTRVARAGFPCDRVTLHGAAGDPASIATALRLGAGRVVLDSSADVHRLAAQVPPGTRQQVLLRVTPGTSRSPARRTNGLSLPDGSAQHTIGRILAQPRLSLAGLHCDVGADVTTAKPYLPAVRRLVGLLARVRDQYGVVLSDLVLGGGHTAAHRPGDPEPDLTALAARVRAELIESCAATALPVPRLVIEPGRALTAPAAVALHRVLRVEDTAHGRVVTVNGDGTTGVPYATAPRVIGRRTAPARRPATLVRHGGGTPATVALLPADVTTGDLLATPAAGGTAPPTDTPLIAVADSRARLLEG
ncbi:diaminopimelate decarboxylase [Streptomyces sp. RFCAC02]|uniref:diaminopimelate decarboxylase family protein n=1 Tax=Streptomyces sp. RFCAC02 TaxID=2499143 RepID=UPI00101F874F|nr:diaminopimelate decarboxylase [Streptomyces sp. RFCAC02]